jgi:hypothetical protein
MTWRPLSLRGVPDARFDEPAEGLPPWLRDLVLDWIRASFTNFYDYEVYVEEAPLRALQLAFRLESPLSGGSSTNQLNDLISRGGGDQEFALDVVDWMLHHPDYFAADHYLETWTENLNGLLRQGGSAWEVLPLIEGNSFQLGRRTVGPVAEVLQETAITSRAHHHLSVAWSKLTGRGPDPSGAYREAVRAVEAIAKPIILPGNDRATMGQMTAAIREKPEKWVTTIGSVQDLGSQMDAVWRGQLDRHGTDDHEVPFNVSFEEADAAFSACLNLVRQFAGGHVVKVEEPNA